MRAFIFSVDAFVAFTLALVAVYSLIFFSSVPSGYHAALAQAHALSSDTLNALQLTPCDSNEVFAREDSCSGDSINMLEYLVYRSSDRQNIPFILDEHVPASYGYRLETRENSAWQVLYDSAGEAGRPPGARRMSVGSYALAFQYSDALPEPSNPYSYRTCTGGIVACGTPPLGAYPVSSANVQLVRLVIYT